MEDLFEARGGCPWGAGVASRAAVGAVRRFSKAQDLAFACVHAAVFRSFSVFPAPLLENRTPEIDLAICENPSRGQRLGRWETAIFYREKGVQNPKFPARAEPLLSPSGGLTGGCAFSLGSAFFFFLRNFRGADSLPRPEEAFICRLVPSGFTH